MPNTSGGYDYVYLYRDHLGNVRLSYTDDPSNPGTPTIIEENNFYPFGLQHKGYNSNINGVENNYFTFNDVEHNESLGLNLYEMDWRHHDPAIGRFLGIDKLAEDVYDFTPYRFGLNNPVLYSDPTGLWEEVDGGYSTTDKDEIQRLLNFINNSGEDISEGDITNFIKEDIAFFKDVENTYTLTGLTVTGKAGTDRDATDFSIHRTQNEIAVYLDYTNYLYTKEDYEMRNRVTSLSSGPGDGILRTILARESRGQYLPLTASNHIDYVGGQTNARLLNFSTYSNLVLSLPGGSGSGQIKPRAYSGIRPSGARNKLNTRSSGGTNARSSGPQAYKGMSFKEFHMKNSHLYRGKFRGRGNYMTHMSIDWRKLTF